MAVVSRIRTVASGGYREVDCLSSDAVGNCVYVSGDKVGDRWQVATADPTDDAKMPAIGVLVSKQTSTTGMIQLFGPCDLFTDMTPGQMVLVGQNGDLLDEVPSIPAGNTFWAQQIGVAAASDVLLLSGSQRMLRYSG